MNKCDIKVFFSPGDNCSNVILKLINDAFKKIDICVFTITNNNISRAIKKAADRGVKIRIITDNDKAYDKGSDIYYLAKEGIDVVVDIENQWMHHKFAIFDRKTVLSGSYNWTRSANNQNENIIVINNSDVMLRFESEFNKLWEKFRSNSLSFF
jgi:phosphatidylserine/phosphatidylglycerophosphate/cardiolipin synthase-like enzyme